MYHIHICQRPAKIPNHKIFLENRHSSGPPLDIYVPYLKDFEYVSSRKINERIVFKKFG